MGTAASAQASEAMQSASAADVQAYLDQLPEVDKAKLKDALAAAALPAPFLAEYFDKVQARTEALITDEEKLLALATSPDPQRKLKEEAMSWFEAEARPLLEKSFKHHDTKGTGVLDREEAAAFFSHLVMEETDLAKAMSALTIDTGIRMSMAELDGLSQETRAELKPIFEKQIKDEIAKAKAEVQKKEDSYKSDKASHDAAAMKVLDVNGDGTIQLPEFLAAFEPDNQKNLELHIALGYLTEEEVKAQQKRQADGPECAQQ